VDNAKLDASRLDPSRLDPSRLDPAARERALNALRTEHLDVLVVGGGIVGIGSAFDAATRGLSVGLVEARDWASGTSSRSSKLVHGGIRYLEQLNFSLVREALTERSLLLRTLAPHLVTPIKFLYPVQHKWWERAYIGAGMMLYDALSYVGGRWPGVPHHRHLSQRQVQMASPSIDSTKIIGGLSYFDGHVDDARYATTLVRSAAAAGAHVANRTSVVEFLKEGDRVVGARVRDLDTAEEFNIRARTVLNATGVWTGQTQKMVGETGHVKVRASKGVHIVVPRSAFKSTMGLLLRTEKSVLFVIPWNRHWIIGTTDTDWNLDLDEPAATSRDIDYILDHVNSVLTIPISRDQIQGVFAGLRPLIASDDSATTTKLSREHVVAHAGPGLVLIAGGKWTTYRVMARDAIDTIAEQLTRDTGRVVPSSSTESLPLIGAHGFEAAWMRRARTAKTAGISLAHMELLLRRYGAEVDYLIDLIEAEPALAQPLPGAREHLAVEAVFAASHESVRHLEDVLVRRMRIGFESADRGVSAAPIVADLIAPILGWNASRRAAEVASYLARVAAERESNELPDDESAQHARLSAPESGIPGLVVS
jgi:glycerol-3-phosphate dehydrogenase